MQTRRNKHSPIPIRSGVYEQQQQHVKPIPELPGGTGSGGNATLSTSKRRESGVRGIGEQIIGLNPNPAGASSSI